MSRDGRQCLIMSQVYPPDPAAVGQHLGDVAEELVSRGWRVAVFTAGRGYDDPRIRYAAREIRNGVRVRRLPFSSFGKGGIAIRLVAQSLFMLQAVIRGCCGRRPDVILVSTSPPFAGYGGVLLGWLRRVPVVWWVMDINPDQMVRSGRLSPRSVFARAFDWMNRVTLRQARDVIVLDRFMRDTVLRKAAVPDKVRVVPPWAHDNVLEDVPRDRNPFRRAQGIEDAFAVMYSGNAGYSTPLDTLLAAARQLQEDSRIKFVFIGGGVVKRDIDTWVATERPPNVLTLPYQPLTELRNSLSAADVHVVSIADEAVGVVHPCKVYGALAVGRPVIALAPRDSYVADILANHDVGWLVQHGEIERLTQLLRELPDLPESRLQAMGAAAKAAAATIFARTTLLGRVCDIIAGHFVDNDTPPRL